MKRKKIKELFRAIEGLSKYTEEKLMAQMSNIYFTTESGENRPIKLIPNTGKYTVPETLIINKIIRSIPIENLPEEVMKINEAANAPLMILTKDQNSETDYALFVRTSRGAIGYAIRQFELPEQAPGTPMPKADVSNIDENGNQIVSDQEIDILKQLVLQ